MSINKDVTVCWLHPHYACHSGQQNIHQKRLSASFKVTHSKQVSTSASALSCTKHAFKITKNSQHLKCIDTTGTLTKVQNMLLSLHVPLEISPIPVITKTFVNNPHLRDRGSEMERKQRQSTECATNKIRILVIVTTREGENYCNNLE